MDFNLLDHHSKSSSEEINDTAAARSYGCIFCKRGFTSAQALGGHMNIHRKDRNPKTNPNSSSSSSFIPPIMSSDYNYVSYNPPNYNYRPPLYHEPYIELPVSARTSHYSFPASQQVRSTSLDEAADDDEGGRVMNRGFSDNEGLVWGQTLNLQAGPLRIHGGGGGAAVSSEEDDVDLELRLGYA